MSYNTNYESTLLLKDGVKLKDVKAEHNKQFGDLLHFGLEFGDTSDMYDIFFEGDMNLGQEQITPLLDFLAPFLNEESIIYAVGDNSDDQWRVVFDGNGHWKILDGYMIFGSLFDNFLNEYKDRLPESLKQKLLEWRAAEKL
jgi:hypothetical protein